jgi:hypothetical protein
MITLERGGIFILSHNGLVAAATGTPDGGTGRLPRSLLRRKSSSNGIATTLLPAPRGMA